MFHLNEEIKINSTVKKYIPLVEFLGQTLGPNYEISLYDLKHNPCYVFAIANQGLTRNLGSPLTDLLLKVLVSEIPKENGYLLNSKGISKSGDVVRSSTMFIKNGDDVVGLLCISSNVSKYERLSKEILALGNMGLAVNEFADYQFSESGHSDRVETYADSASEIINTVLNDAVQKFGTSIDRMSYEEKLQIIADLNTRGIFKLKGAVTQVAEKMQSSDASIYRYLSQLKRNR